MSEQHDLLRFSLEALDEIDRLVSRGRAEFDASEDRQRALAFCWIAVGSALKDYAAVEGIPQGQPPLSSPIRFRDRLAHQPLRLLDANILWRTSASVTFDLRRVIASLAVRT